MNTKDMQRTLLTLWVLIFSFSLLFGQTDSLIRELANTPRDTNRVNLYNQIAFDYLYSDRIKSRAYADSANVLANQIDYGRGYRHSVYLFATIAHFDGETEQSKAYALKAVELSQEAGDKATQARAYNTLAMVHSTQFNFQEALEAIQEATRLCRETGNKEREAVALYTTSTIYQYLNENDIARSYLQQAADLFRELGNDYYLGIAYQGMAVLSFGEEALEYAQTGYEILKETDDVQGQGMCIWTMGDAHYEMGNNEDALAYYQQAKTIFEEIAYAEGIANVNSNIGKILARTGRYEEAYPHLINALTIARKSRFDDVRKATYQGLSYYHAGKGNSKLAMDYLDSMVVVSDTLFNRDKSEALLEAEARLKTKEKEAQLAQSELELQRKTNQNNALLLGALLAIAALLIIFFYFRNRQRIKQQQAEIDLQLERQQAEQLRELDELKSNFFANISHEFRTPLTLILGPLEQMRQGNFEGNYPQYYDIMYRNGKRLQELINQLLDLSKLESSNMSMNYEPVDLVQYTRQIGGSMESWAHRKNIDYQIAVPSSPLWAMVDKDKLEKILTNLLSNALKFTPANGTVRLSFQHEREQDLEMLSFQVSDTGPGIPKEELDKIFERFYQSSHQQDGTASSGIGLALTKELVHFQGGDIQVESREGKGSIFTVHLPVQTTNPVVQKSADTPTEEVAVALDQKDPLPGNLDAPMILVVEDNEDVRTYIKDQLATEYQVREAVNGKVGLEEAQRLIPDLIITDIMMPEMDGTTLARHLKTDEKTSHIPVIMLTAKAEQGDKLEGLETGADDYLIKPFDPEELRVRTRNLIKQRKQLREHYSNNPLFTEKEVAVTSIDEQFLQRLREIIESNMDNELLSVEDISKQIGLSRSQLHRKLKAVTGIAPSAFLRRIRLQRARTLLEKQAGNITEVGFMVGFSNLPYFSKCFKEEFGVSPSEFTQMRKS
jgi:signal transduction histidine kinase/DNA-binding response OmpR family regulator